MAKSRIPAMPADDEAESRRSIPGRGGSNIPCRSPIIAVGDAWEPGFHFLGNYGSAISQPTSAPKATISTISTPAGAAAEAGGQGRFPRRADRDRLRPIKAPSPATWRRGQMAAYRPEG